MISSFIKKYYIVFSSLFLLNGCNDKSNDNYLKVGVTSGPHAIIMEKVKEIAEIQGMKIKIEEFNDFIMPNQALYQGDIHVNNYQHEPFFISQRESRGYDDLEIIGKSLLMPMAVFSNSLKSHVDLKENDKVAIPNDPTNGSRALILLHKMGVIKLASGVDLPSVRDIESNIKNIKIIEIEAPQLPRILSDVAMAAINIDWIVLSGMDPKNHIFIESKDSPYANVFVAKKKSDRKDDIKKLIDIYKSDEIKEFILKKFSGSIIPAWGE